MVFSNPANAPVRRAIVLAIVICAATIPPTAVAEHEQVVNTATASITHADGKLYWSVQPGPDCFTGLGPGRIDKKSAGTTGFTSTILPGSFCSPRARLLRNDGAYVYFVDAEPTPDVIRRLWIGGGDVETLATANGSVTDLEVDETRIWWVDDDGIQYAPKAGGVASLYQGNSIFAEISEIAITQYRTGSVFWLVGLPGNSQLISRRDKTSSAIPDDITPVLNAPVHLSVNTAGFHDEEFVFWAEGDGDIRRVRSNGTGLQTLVNNNGNPDVLGIVVDDENVYWTQSTGSSNGLVQRVPRSGGATTPMVANLNFPTSPVQNDAHIYFADSRVFRVRKDAAKVLPDLSWVGLEITQVLQTIPTDPNITLIEGKSTVVRAFPTSTQDRPAVFAELRGTRSGAPLPGSPLRARRELVFVGAGVGVDRDGRDLFEFRLPPEWRSGTVSLQVVINPNRASPETNIANNMTSRTVTFTPGGPTCVFAVPISTDGGIYRASDPGFWDIIDRFETVWPVAEVRVNATDFVLEELECCEFFGPFPVLFLDSFEYDDDEDVILFTILAFQWFTQFPFACGLNEFYMGMIDPSAPGGPGGMAYRPGRTSFVKMQSTGWGPAYNRPRAGGVMAQEIAHNKGRQHVSCGCPASVDFGYPYCSGTECCEDPCESDPPPLCNAIGPPETETGLWGYDLTSNTAISPTASRDFLSYCGPRWVSDYTWGALQSVFAASAPVVTRSTRPSSDTKPTRSSNSTGPTRSSDISDSAVTGADCTLGSGDCCADNGTPGCNESTCCEAVCSVDSFCCEKEWDSICAARAEDQCTDCAPTGCGDGGDCCADNGTPGCDDGECCAAVCACDPFCCETGWDEFCAGTGFQGNGCGAELLCNTCFQSDSDMLTIAGLARPDEGTAEIVLAYRAPDGFLHVDDFDLSPTESDSDAAGHDGYSVALVDESGGLITSQPVRIRENSAHDVTRTETFTVHLPFDSQTRRLRILENERIVAERFVTANAPSVNITAPELGTLQSPNLTIQWNGSDDDADAIIYSIQYSPDNGSTWHPINPVYPDNGTGTNTLTIAGVDGLNIPGSQSLIFPGSSRIRVIASDGINTSIALSKRFRLPRHAPSAIITSPGDGASFFHNDTILLRGRGYDAEDGPVNTANLTWTVNGRGIVGTGRETTIEGLPPGPYTVTLTAEDADQQTGSTSININVGTAPIETSNCCEGNGSPGCDDAACRSAVCACDPFCCDNEWDAACAGTGFVTDCGAEVLCHDICTGGPPADADNDGTPDSIDNCTNDSNSAQTDSDGDGVGNSCDNCPDDDNPTQDDFDGDNVGDACDLCPTSANDENDPDGDGICLHDNCPEKSNLDQADNDMDGVGDACDNCVGEPNPGQGDCNDDGLGDACEIASTPDIDCNQNTVPDDCDIAFQTSRDANRNAVPDECECPGNFGIPVNLSAFATFNGCVSGPAGGTAIGCDCSDFDNDDDIDLNDYSLLQRLFTP